MERRVTSHTEEEEMNQRRRLLGLARKGDEKAIDKLFELYQVKVYTGETLKKSKSPFSKDPQPLNSEKKQGTKVKKPQLTKSRKSSASKSTKTTKKPTSARHVPKKTKKAQDKPKPSSKTRVKSKKAVSKPKKSVKPKGPSPKTASKVKKATVKRKKPKKR